MQLRGSQYPWKYTERIAEMKQNVLPVPETEWLDQVSLATSFYRCFFREFYIRTLSLYFVAFYGIHQSLLQQGKFFVQQGERRMGRERWWFSPLSGAALYNGIARHRIIGHSWISLFLSHSAEQAKWLGKSTEQLTNWAATQRTEVFLQPPSTNRYYLLLGLW